MTHDVAHHQEVVGKSLLTDDAELQIQPVPQLGADGGVPPPGALERELPQLREGGAGIGNAWRYDPLPDRDPVDAPLRDVHRRADCLGTVGEVSRQIIGRTEPGSMGPDLLRREGGQRGVQGDGPKQAVTAPVLPMRRDHSVGGDGGQPQPARGGQRLVAPPAGPKLGVQILGTAEVECLF